VILIILKFLSIELIELMGCVDISSSDIWSRIRGNVSQCNQSQVNTRHEVWTGSYPLESNDPTSSMALLMLIR
jgi:hypothetical protein